MLIPHPDEIGRPGRYYGIARQLLDELDIVYVVTLNAQDVMLGYATDAHWKTPGTNCWPNNSTQPLMFPTCAEILAAT